MTTCPSAIPSRSIERVRLEDEEDAESLDGDGEETPRVEKFQLPAGERRNVIRGSCRRSDSIRRCFDVTSGSNAMPTRTDLAVTNGVRLNIGSSAIDKSSMTALAERTESEIRRI